MENRLIVKEDKFLNSYLSLWPYGNLIFTRKYISKYGGNTSRKRAPDISAWLYLKPIFEQGSYLFVSLIRWTIYIKARSFLEPLQTLPNSWSLWGFFCLHSNKGPHNIFFKYFSSLNGRWLGERNSVQEGWEQLLLNFALSSTWTLNEDLLRTHIPSLICNCFIRIPKW